MESVIGSKKYFKSLGPTESDYYHRHKTGFLPTNYSSYNNTLGRCSTGPYVHLNNFPLHVDVGGMAMANQYRYNSWGMMNDGGSRKLAPSVSYSSAGDSQKTRVKSFTILLMTAAFIVMLAVLSVAGLAFYFSTFKSEFSEPLIAFDGEFMVVRGDVFTTGLKYNHTTAFEQKSQIYEQMIRKAVVASGLTVLHCEVLGFGEGPLINVIFRVYLDIRKIPASISSIEDHIIESIVKEFAISSTVNSIKIDRHSVQVKRIVNNDQLGTASLMGLTQSTMFDGKPPSDTKFNTESSAAQQSHHNGRLDASDQEQHMPGVLHGSFEVTKTDADITQKKSSPQFPATSTTTLRPFNVTNVGSSIKVKTKKITIEKVTIAAKPMMPTTERGFSVTSASAETVSTPRNTARIISTTTTTTIKPTTKTTTPTPTTSSTTTTSTTTEKPTTITAKISTPSTGPHKANAVVQPNNLPQLNEQLFTHAPILDNKPWLPIDPTVSVMQTNTDTASSNTASYSHRLTNNDFDTTTTTEPNRVYHSFSNPAFVTSLQSIEPLGSNIVRPYPIPVDKINMKPTHNRLNSSPNKLHVTNGNYEHLGGGIMVKKSEEKKKETTTDNPKPTTTLEQLTSLGIPVVIVPKEVNTTATTIVNVTTTKNPITTTIATMINETDPVNATIPTLSNATYVRVETIHPTATSTQNTTSWDQPLFPMNLKPGAIDGRHKSAPLRKTYNDTLQAWIVENDQSNKPANTLRNIGSTVPSKSNIQNISVIFDTLASKLGITTKNVSAKGPTLFGNTQHKANTKLSNRAEMMANKNLTEHLQVSTSTTTIVTTTSSTTTVAQTPSSASSLMATEAVYGEAEIEEVDPTQYEEILQNDRMRARYEVTTPATVTLVTLMPVKSNSGLRLPILMGTSSSSGGGGGDGSSEEIDFDGIIRREF